MHSAWAREHAAFSAWANACAGLAASTSMAQLMTTASVPIQQPNNASASAATRLYIVGDVHLDGSDNVFPLFLDQLQQRAPARLVILGDLFEYWLETPAMVAMHAPVLNRLRALSAAGWQLDLVLGNREFVAGRMLAISSACRLHWPTLNLTIAKRRLRIVHGDRLCHDPHYRLFAAIMRSFIWRALYLAIPGMIQNRIAQVLRKRSRLIQQRRHQAPAAARSQVFIDRRKVQGAARGCDTLIAGHIHDSWRRTIGGVDMLLVGDWPQRTGHWIEVDAHGTVTRHTREF